MVWSVSGDVDTAEILAELEERLAALARGGRRGGRPLAAAARGAEPRRRASTTSRRTSRRARCGSATWRPAGTTGRTPSAPAIQVMDHILGASGFTSRLMQRIRSDEGLAYGAGGRFGFNPLGPSAYSLGYQSKSETVALAAAIALEEVRRMRDEAVSAEELAAGQAFAGGQLPAAVRERRGPGGHLRERRVPGPRPRLLDPLARADRGGDRGGRDRGRRRSTCSRIAMVMLVVGIWDDIAPRRPPRAAPPWRTS